MKLLSKPVMALLLDPEISAAQAIAQQAIPQNTGLVVKIMKGELHRTWIRKTFQQFLLEVHYFRYSLLTNGPDCPIIETALTSALT